MQLCVLVPQTLTDATQMKPPAYVGPNDTVIELVVDEPDAPAGSTQSYEVAPGTATIE